MSFSEDISKEQAIEIVADECPYCGGSLEDGIIFDESPEYIGINVQCIKCHKKLIRWNKITFDHFEDENAQELFCPQEKGE
jgi:hypothetical protein